MQGDQAKRWVAIPVAAGDALVVPASGVDEAAHVGVGEDHPRHLSPCPAQECVPGACDVAVDEGEATLI